MTAAYQIHTPHLAATPSLHKLEFEWPSARISTWPFVNLLFLPFSTHGATFFIIQSYPATLWPLRVLASEPQRIFDSKTCAHAHGMSLFSIMKRRSRHRLPPSLPTNVLGITRVYVLPSLGVRWLPRLAAAEGFFYCLAMVTCECGDFELIGRGPGLQGRRF